MIGSALPIALSQPVWLLLVVPLLASLWLWRMPTRLLSITRGVIYVLALTTMAGLALRIPVRTGTVVVLADRSMSMPVEGDDLARESIETIENAKPADDALAVIGFGRTGAVERTPGGVEFTTFKAGIARDASDYAGALEQALSMIQPGAPGRIVVIGDGRATGKDPASIAARARARGIAIDYRLIERPTTNDVAIERLDTPPRVAPGESYMLSAHVSVPVPQDVVYEARRGNTVIARGRRNLNAGRNRLTFRDTAEQPGNQRYTISVSGAGEDPVPENNRADVIVGVDGPKPILHLTTHPGSSQLGRLLRAGKLDVRSVEPDKVRWTLDELARHSSLLIENVPANDIGDGAMDTISAWVKDTGAGLMMTGGKDSYGPGGYYKSPLEPVMPVSMELRREHRKLALAIVVVLDRSGSMGMTVAGGKTKMDLANLASAEVLDLLSSMDEMGVVAVDSQPHVIAPLQKLENKGALRSKILSIDSMGGGIFVFEGLKQGVSMLKGSSLGTRHIILFSDAQDSEQPGGYKQLLSDASAAGMTCSVIGLGKPTDVDANFLRDVAQRGKGRIFFTERATELPKLFAQDTFVVARSTFIDEPTPARVTPGLVALAGQTYRLDRPLGGYNLTYLRDGATMGLVTTDEYKAPIAAWWQAGAGRSVVYTGEADGKHTGPIAGWAKIGDLFTSLARWAAGDDQTLPGGALLTQELRSGVATVTLHLDPTRFADPFAATPTVRTLRGTPGQPPRSSDAVMRWTGPDQLSHELSLRGNEVALATVNVDEATINLPPVMLAYSPEFAPVREGAGVELLAKLAAATGGQRRDILKDVWATLPKTAKLIDISPWLAIAAMLLLVFEVFERRSGMLSAARRRQMRQATAREAAEDKALDEAATRQRSVASPLRSAKQRAARRSGQREEKPDSQQTPDAPSAAAPAPPEATDDAGSITDALSAARQRAKGRNRR